MSSEKKMTRNDDDLIRKEPVRLRRKKTKSGYSLYLDAYWNGKRSYEFLKLYLNKSTDRIARAENETTLQIALHIKCKRILALRMETYGSMNILARPSFLEYFAELVSQRHEFDSNAISWKGALKHLIIFLGDTNPAINEITEAWLLEFKAYLMREDKEKGKRILAANTGHAYFNRIRSALRHAFERNLIDRNPGNLVKSIRTEGTKREFLTLQEVQKLTEKPCDELYLKEAFLFSVLTGLRWSDIFNLTWADVKGNEAEGWYVQPWIHKTKEYLVLPISKQAHGILGERKNSNEKVFKYLQHSSRNTAALSRWALSAGIYKKITFHCARHTHATLLLTEGVSIYTIPNSLDINCLSRRKSMRI